MKEILQTEDDLQEIVQLVGKDSLSEDQKSTLEVAKIVREDFLQQNGFTDYDFMCPLAKTIGMMKVIVTFHDIAQKTIVESTGDLKIGWYTIYTAMRDLITKITSMKFEMPRQSDAHFMKVFPLSGHWLRSVKLALLTRRRVRFCCWTFSAGAAMNASGFPVVWNDSFFLL